MLKNWPMSLVAAIAAALLICSSGASCNEELAQSLNQVSNELGGWADDLGDDDRTIGEMIDDWLD